MVMIYVRRFIKISNYLNHEASCYLNIHGSSNREGIDERQSLKKMNLIFYHYHAYRCQVSFVATC